MSLVLFHKLRLWRLGSTIYGRLVEVGQSWAGW